MAENRTRINCLEGNYADHYTTNAHTMAIYITNYIRTSFTLVQSKTYSCVSGESNPDQLLGRQLC